MPLNTLSRKKEPKKSNAITCVNVNRLLTDNSRDSFKDAASRWEVDFVEISEPSKAGVYFQKFEILADGLGYERVLNLDADMLIRKDCPNVFDLVPPNKIGVVSAAQHPWDRVLRMLRRNSINKWIKRTYPKTRARKINVPTDEEVINGGFYLATPKLHADIFRDMLKVAKSFDYEGGEQPIISIKLKNEYADFPFWLPHDYNSTQGDVYVSEPGKMNRYIYHFLKGTKEKHRIEKTNWKKIPHVRPHKRSRALIDFLPKDRKLKGVELGVMRGINAGRLLDNLPNIEVLYLVDCWNEYAKDSTYAESEDRNSLWRWWDWRTIFHTTVVDLSEHYSRTRFLQLHSEVAAKCFEDESLDFIFIDADHSYEGVKNDILAWYPKIKSGGLISGHDYDNPRFSKWGVKKAVDEIFGEDSIKKGNGNTWFYFKREGDFIKVQKG